MSSSKSTWARAAAACRRAKRRLCWHKPSPPTTCLRFAGLQAYHGRAQHQRGVDERHHAIALAAQDGATTPAH
jgi:hypothetical protein